MTTHEIKMKKGQTRLVQPANWFDYLNVVLMIVMMVIMIYPLWYCLVGSLNEGTDYLRGGVYLWPRKLTFANYEAIFYDDSIISAFKITVLKCVVGTVTSLLFTSIVAYGLSYPGLRFKNFYIALIMFTMFFGGGLIPYFLLIKDIGLYNSFWVYILPSLFSVWNMIIIQSFMRDLPQALFESARIDGAREYRIFFQIVIPLSKPVLAAIALFTFVGHWNSYFDSMMYTSAPELQTIQLFLKKVITDPAFSNSVGAATVAAVPDQAHKITPRTIKLATMMVTALPVIAIYPFLQKHFVKGIMIGAVKG